MLLHLTLRGESWIELLTLVGVDLLRWIDTALPSCLSIVVQTDSNVLVRDATPTGLDALRLVNWSTSVQRTTRLFRQASSLLLDDLLVCMISQDAVSSLTCLDMIHEAISVALCQR